jgi:hypothetical protein
MSAVLILIQVVPPLSLQSLFAAVVVWFDRRKVLSCQDPSRACLRNERIA